jgi:hypothetical protein
MRLARLFLPALAVAEALQVYPVAGAQMSAAAIWFVPVGALCIGDGVRILTDCLAFSPEVLRIATGGLAAVALWSVIVQPGISAAVTYAHTPATTLAGAQLLRIDPGQATDYERLVTLLRYNCTAFVSYPGINSLYVWSGIRPPRESLPGGWMTLIDNERQARVVSELRRAKRPCVVRNDGLAAPWIAGQPNPKSPLNGPLITYLTDDFHVAEQFDGYEFLLPNT